MIEVTRKQDGTPMIGRSLEVLPADAARQSQKTTP